MLFPQDLWCLLNVGLSLPVRPGFRMERAAPSPASRRRSWRRSMSGCLVSAVDARPSFLLTRSVHYKLMLFVPGRVHRFTAPLSFHRW